MTYQIISDSTCDLSPEQVKKYNIHLMPLYVQLGDKTFRDGVDIHPDDIYAHVAAGGDLGASIAPQLMGIVVDNVSESAFAVDMGAQLNMLPEQIGLKSGMLVSAVFPIAGAVLLILTLRYFKKQK